MKDRYSLYEAKARLSALVRQVREGRRIVITVHGEPAAELRPIQAGPQTIEDRLAELIARGEAIPARDRQARIRPGARRPGALKRFLESRD